MNNTAKLVKAYVQCSGITDARKISALTGVAVATIYRALNDIKLNALMDGNIPVGENENIPVDGNETCSPSRAHKLPEEIKKTPLPPKGDQQGDLLGDEKPSLEDEKPSKAQEAFDLFNALAREKDLPVARKLTPALKTRIEARLKEGGGLDEWKELLEIVARSPLLLGKVAGKNGGAPFKATLDWIAGPQNYSKIINGQYERINGASIHSRMNGLSEEEQYRLVRQQMRAN